jgi:hypothetical protein
MVVALTKKLALVGGFDIPLGYWNSTLNKEGRAPPCFKLALNFVTAKSAVAIHFCPTNYRSTLYKNFGIIIH